jgi:queuine/archaeosine tRNA-ribosyltransferase
MDAPGNAIGGLSVGEPTEMIYDIVHYPVNIFLYKNPAT